MLWKGLMKRLIPVFIIATATTGCDQIEHKMADHYANNSLELSFVRDLSSPDNALKSWWKFLDATDKKLFENCQYYIERQPVRESYYSAFMTGDLLSIKSEQVKECKLKTFSRVIQEVKQETETRAVALATIKNTTPSNMTPSESEKADREKGSSYRYLIEKDKEEWKISQVYKLSTYSFDKNDPWQPEYKRYSESYPAAIYTSQ